MPADGAAKSGGGQQSAASSPLQIARDGPVVIWTLNRPEARNSLSEALLATLLTEIDRAAQDNGIAAIVVSANGPAFCAGHDLKELTARRGDPDGGAAYFHLIMTRCAEVMQALVKCPKPVIAAVEGVATAAGCQLVATCDLAVASDTAKFSTPGVNIGLFCSTPMVALTRNVPRKRAMELLLLGEMLPAHEAAQFGLINRVVSAGQALIEAIAMAQKIASKSPLTVALGKETFYRQIEAPLADAYVDAAEVMVRNMLARDAEEGIGAFIEKRTPSWKGC
jgi:enoyl-CoA hydratase/carnithine racemase